jgi:hypothetical protein
MAPSRSLLKSEYNLPFIEIIISPAGQSQVQTRGFSGMACRTGSQFVERALGHVASEHLTAEFYDVPLSQQSSEIARTSLFPTP